MNPPEEKPEKFNQVQESLETHGMRKGFACLFYGTPGTGKTETVLQIARKQVVNNILHNTEDVDLSLIQSACDKERLNRQKSERIRITGFC